MYQMLCHSFLRILLPVPSLHTYCTYRIFSQRSRLGQTFCSAIHRRSENTPCIHYDVLALPPSGFGGWRLLHGVNGTSGTGSSRGITWNTCTKLIPENGVQKYGHSVYIFIHTRGWIITGCLDIPYVFASRLPGWRCTPQRIFRESGTLYNLPVVVYEV